MQQLPPEYEKIIQMLADSEVEFVVIGGVALVLLGSATITTDFYAMVKRSKENAARIAAALEPYHQRPRGLDPGLPSPWDTGFVSNMSVLTLETDLGDIDFLTEPDGAPPYGELEARAVSLEVCDRQVAVAHIDDLIAMKRAAGRPKDLIHIMELQAIKKLTQE